MPKAEDCEKVEAMNTPSEAAAKLLEDFGIYNPVAIQQTGPLQVQGWFNLQRPV